jgi:DNA polymerase III alpha subunit
MPHTTLTPQAIAPTIPTTATAVATIGRQLLATKLLTAPAAELSHDHHRPSRSVLELAAADAWATGVTPGSHPLEFVRERLTDLGALRVVDLADVDDDTRIRVGGAITHRQRPATAGGITFLNLEDETGMLNVVVEQNTWSAFRSVARANSAMLVRGIVQRSPEGVISLRADRLEHLEMTIQHASRDSGERWSAAGVGCAGRRWSGGPPREQRSQTCGGHQEEACCSNCPISSREGSPASRRIPKTRRCRC